VKPVPEYVTWLNHVSWVNLVVYAPNLKFAMFVGVLHVGACIGLDLTLKWCTNQMVKYRSAVKCVTLVDLLRTCVASLSWEA
jgi:hypothetical protein